MTETDLLFEALLIAGKYAREYLPTEIPKDMNYVGIYAQGSIRDPQGLEFVDYWMRVAQKRLQQKEDKEEYGMV